MRYLGGKSRYGQQIASLIPRNKPIYEPFCGALWVTQWLSPTIASDIDEDLILLYEAMRRGFALPEHCSEDEYNDLKDSDPSPLRTFVGYACSYAGKWFGGYARGNDAFGERNFCRESKVALLSKLSACKDVTFEHRNYQNINVHDATIYADPPYAHTTGYKHPFCRTSFWQWANRMIEQGNKVFVSEYAAPTGWRAIWSASHFSKVDDVIATTEHLFVHDKTLTFEDELLSL